MMIDGKLVAVLQIFQRGSIIQKGPKIIVLSQKLSYIDFYILFITNLKKMYKAKTMVVLT